MNFQNLIEDKAFLSTIFFVLGGLITAIITYIKNRLRTLEYQVIHERVAVAADDSIFGNVRVTWQSNDVKNLFLCTAILENNTTKDLSNLSVKVYTGDSTLLLNQYVELVGTSYVPTFTESYKKFIEVPNGQNPTAQQTNTYYHNREFFILTLNRGQKFLTRFLVTDANSSPAIWMDTLHPGIKFKYRPNQNHFLGVPIRITLPWAIVICFIVVILSALFLNDVWISSILCILIGLFAQIIAALFYRTFKKIYNVFLG